MAWRAAIPEWRSTAASPPSLPPEPLFRGPARSSPWPESPGAAWACLPRTSATARPPKWWRRGPKRPSMPLRTARRRYGAGSPDGPASLEYDPRPVDLKAAVTTQEDAPLLITEHELIALIALAGTTGALKCQSLFRLDQSAGAPLEQAGVATLLERGLMTIEAESLVPAGPAIGVAGVLADSDAWLEVALVTPKAEHVYFLFGSGNGALVLSLSKYGVHELRPVNDADGMFTTAIEMVRFYLGTA